MSYCEDHEVLTYILTAFPQELKLLDQLATEVRKLGGPNPDQADVEPVLVTILWMRRVLRHAQKRQLDLKGIFALSACLTHELPKVRAHCGIHWIDQLK
jgi:hypothetical protein